MCCQKVVVLGASGQVGRAVCALLPDAVALTRAEVDMADPDFLSVVDGYTTPGSTLINLSAFTAVDAAEDPANHDAVWTVNAEAPGLLAQHCADKGARMIHVSTDYVFSGDKAVGELNSEEDPTGPLSEYGRSKLEGERAALAAGATVVRTSWVYSGPTNTGGDFVKTMVRLADSGVDPSVVDDQWGRPTFAGDLARALVGLIGVAVPVRLVHVAGSGEPITWFTFARAIFEDSGHDPERVSPIPTVDYPTPARRPLNAALGVERWKMLCETLQLPDMPAWRDSLREVLR